MSRMPRLNELLAEINKFINNDELAVLADEAEFTQEVTDEAFESINNSLKSLMNIEAAINNPEVIEKLESKIKGKLKGDIFGRIDRKIEQFGSAMLGEEAKETLKSNTDTYSKFTDFIKMIQDHYKDSSPDKYRAQIEQLNIAINDLNDKHSKELQDKENELLTERQNFENSIVKSQFYSIAEGYAARFADVYAEDEIKQTIIKSVFDKINSIAALKPDENGEIILYDKNNPELKLFEGGQPVKLNELIEKNVYKYMSKQPPAKEIRTFKFAEKKPVDLPDRPMLQDLQKSRQDFGIHD